MLLIIMYVIYEEDDIAGSFSWLIFYVKVGWFISIPIAIVYISSVVRSVWYRNYVNNIFLGLHCFNILQVLCIAVFAIIPQKECTPERMEADFRANHQKIEMLIRITRSWLPDSTGFSVEYSKHGKLTDWGVSSKQEVNFQGVEIGSQKEQEKELRKIGLSLERLDSVRLALQKMDYRGLSINKGGAISDYTEIVYGKTGNKEFNYRIYDKPLADSLVYKLNRCYNLIVYNRYVVFSCVEDFDYDSPFPGKYAYLQKHTLSK
ncbi:hypothetical protein [Prevotella melaninogenica]|uniref:hypothetical protein n=1 Tax=Prevotella melaninogenica TaxID=28132 RepID=UPI001D146B56|nr:hypothetical protein [Prevotella melaninogenica]UEB00051.1 hypothetical protein LK413_03220 [Prevotella melaninogenica]